MQARSPHDALRALSRRHDSVTLTAALRLAQQIGHASQHDLQQRLDKALAKDKEKQEEEISAGKARLERICDMPSVVTWWSAGMRRDGELRLDTA
jgi:hypothetical protein